MTKKIITHEDTYGAIIVCVSQEEILSHDHSNIRSVFSRLDIGCTDGDAFLYHVEETVVSISSGGTVILTNDFMPVVPVITVTSETTLRWAIDGESFQKTVSAGTWEIPELELRHGNNTISVTGEGNVAFVYREGRL